MVIYPLMLRWAPEPANLPLWVRQYMGTITMMMVVAVPTAATMLMMVGAHVYYMGNQGRYPGYPLDELIKFWG